MHQLRDQEEEEIEKTLDEAKSIIQKLEEKLHHKDDKIRKYKEKLEIVDKEKSEIEKQRVNIEDDYRDKEKNMKLKLLWAQMEKKDLATTILKLENSTHRVPQSEHKPRHPDSEYTGSRVEKVRNSLSAERVGLEQTNLADDTKRYSEAYYRHESKDRARSGSNPRASLRRRNVEGGDPLHDKTRSAISVESRPGHRPHDISITNHACGENSMDIREKWFQNLLTEKNRMIQDLEMQLHKKDEEVQFLVRQLDYMQTKYRQKKMQLSVIKNNIRTDEDRQSSFSMKPERDHVAHDAHHSSQMADQDMSEYNSHHNDSRYYSRHGVGHRGGEHKSYEYEVSGYEKH